MSGPGPVGGLTLRRQHLRGPGPVGGLPLRGGSI